MVVAVTGATGLLGPWLLEEARSLGDAVGIARRGAELRCDLTDKAAVRSLVGKLRPKAVFHAAALTDVDLCEQQPELARAANTESTRNVVQAAVDVGAHVVFVSTDQVYPDRAGLHAEENVGPVNEYGRTKLAAETAVLDNGGLVLRTNFFGPSRSPGRESLSDFFIRSLRGGHPVRLFTDVLFSPLHVRTVARFAVEGLEREVTGCFNVGCRRGSSKHDFALLIARHLALPTADAVPAVSDALPGRAPRPHDLRMDVARIERALGRVMPTLDDEVKKL